MIGIRHYGRRRDRFKYLWIPRRYMLLGIMPIACPECEGTGWWGYGPTPDECGPCVDCKGTGKILIDC